MVRLKNRYLVFQVTWKDGRVDTGQSESTLLKSIREGMVSLFGQVALASAMASCQVKYYNPYTGCVLVRCRRDEYRHVWAVVTCIREIQNRVCRFRMHRVSGNVSLAINAIRQEEEKHGHAVIPGANQGQGKTRAAYSSKLDSIDM